MVQKLVENADSKQSPFTLPTLSTFLTLPLDLLHQEIWVRTASLGSERLLGDVCISYSLRALLQSNQESPDIIS